MDDDTPIELYEVLGRITAMFSELEITVFVAISLLISDNSETVKRLVGGDSFDVMLTKLNSIFIFKIHDELLLEKFAKLKKRVEDVNIKRNRYLHSSWLLDNDRKIVRTKSKRRQEIGKPSSEYEYTDVQTLKDFVQEIGRVIHSTGEIISGIDALKKAGKLNG